MALSSASVVANALRLRGALRFNGLAGAEKRYFLSERSGRSDRSA